MAVAAVLSVLCAALIAMGAARLGHYVARNRRMPDVGAAIGTAAGVVFSFFILTPPFLMVSSAQDLGLARKRNYAEAGALLAQRRVRVADIQGGLPLIMVVTLIGAAAFVAEHGI